MPGDFDSFEEENLHKDEPDHGHDPQTTTSTSHTPYMIKSIQANEASGWPNFFAAFCSWLTLAGFVVFPGAFTSLKSSPTLAGSSGGKLFQYTIKRVPVLVIAGICCGVGTVGTSILWYLLRHNAIWLVGHIFLPGLLHSFIGLMTTIVNVYTAQGGHWSTTAKVTIVVIGVFSGNMSILYLIYKYWILEKLKTPLDKVLAKGSNDRDSDG
ncbi:hypothetical protein BDZ45DRAFT_594438 [Acephala macrosclerotiorum]|nr:hypothetical protein BDZ45DRAFT_594438 [Acephala macrosclerotiorum]